MPVLLPKERLGTRIADKYQIEAILGRGGMGVVYKGTHVWTARPVAVKIMGPEFADDEHMAMRFLREARSAASLSHPNVVDVLDMGRAEDGAVYLVLEHLEGHSLGDRLDEQGRLSVEETLAICFPVMDALTDAHEKGIVHRDLKPDNIFLSLDPKGEVVPKLLDFGVAKVLSSRSAVATQTGTVLGTPHYMSPEQARGSADVGPASDVWALGVVMYQCMSGKFLYDTGDLLSMLAAIAMGPDPTITLAGVHPAVRRAIERALRKDLKERYPDMQAFGLAMRLAAHAASIQVRPGLLPRVRSVPPASPAEREERRRSERPPPGMSASPPGMSVPQPKRTTEAPTMVDRKPSQPGQPAPRFELELPVKSPPEARPPRPRAPKPLELVDVSPVRAPFDRGVAGRAGQERPSRSALGHWYSGAPSEIRQLGRVLLITLLVSIAYGVGMALWRAF